VAFEECGLDVATGTSTTNTTCTPGEEETAVCFADCVEETGARSWGTSTSISRLTKPLVH
jgi:hypothetical protein